MIPIKGWKVRVMKDRKSTKRFLWLLSFVALACQGDPGPSLEGRLLPADDNLTAEQKRLREMQYMIVVSADPDDGAQEVWDLGRPGADWMVGNLLGKGQGLIVCAAKNQGADICRVATCYLGYELGATARLLQHSEGFAVTPRALNGSVQVHQASDALRVGGADSAFASNVTALRFPPQSAPTRAWFAKQAAVGYEKLIIEARKALDDGLNENTSCDAEARADLATGAAAALRQALIGLERATEEASRVTIAVADQQLGSSTQSSISTARALAGEDLSRAAAAHLYLGGKPGIQGDTTKALCTSFEVTQQTQKAIDIIRQLAPPPVQQLEQRRES
jgi:hypothetical protein